MFTINIKGKANPKTPQLVKLEIIFFKTGYARATKVLNISGPINDWDNKSQQFKSKGTETIERNKRLIELKTKYLKVAEDFEDQGAPWSPVQWSHYFDNVQKKKSETKAVSVGQMVDIVIDRLKKRERIKNGKVITSAGTAATYIYLRTSLEEFTLKKYNRALSSYYFTDLTEEFVKDFILHTQKIGIERGNAACLSDKLKKFVGVVHYAQEWMGIPHSEFEIFKNVE